MLFDTHAHLNADQFKDDLEEVINRAKKKASTISPSLALTVPPSKSDRAC